MKKQVLILAALIALPLLAGCSGRGAYNPTFDPQERSKVIMIDRSMVRSFKVVSEITPTRLDGGELEAGIVIENATGKDIRADYKFVFVDRDGGELDSTAWTPKLFIRGTRETLKSNSLNPEAADYRVYIRPQQ